MIISTLWNLDRYYALPCAFFCFNDYRGRVDGGSIERSYYGYVGNVELNERLHEVYRNFASELVYNLCPSGTEDIRKDRIVFVPAVENERIGRGFHGYESGDGNSIGRGGKRTRSRHEIRNGRSLRRAYRNGGRRTSASNDIYMPLYEILDLRENRDGANVTGSKSRA